MGGEIIKTESKTHTSKEQAERDASERNRPHKKSKNVERRRVPVASATAHNVASQRRDRPILVCIQLLFLLERLHFMIDE